MYSIGIEALFNEDIRTLYFKNKNISDAMQEVSV